MNSMHKHTQAVVNDVNGLAEDARSLITATTAEAAESVANTRNRLTAALDVAKKKAIKSAKSADAVVRDYPYQSIGVAFGVGALVGFLLTRRD